MFAITFFSTRHEAVTVTKFVGVIVGLGGVITITGADAFHTAGNNALANAAIVAGAVCYAIAAIFGTTFGGISPIVTSAGTMICASVIMVPASLLHDSPWNLIPSPASAAATLFLATFSTVGALVIYFRLLTTLGSMGTSSVSYLRAGVALLLGTLFLHEPLSWYAALGLALVVTGVALINGQMRWLDKGAKLRTEAAHGARDR